MNKENVVHLHNGVSYYSVVKSNELMKFASKSMELEETILGETTQTQKDEHGMYPHKGY